MSLFYILSLLGFTFLLHLFSLSLGSFQSLLVFQVFHLLQVCKRIRILHHVTIYRDSSSTITIVSQHLIGMFSTISISHIELGANFNGSINDASHFLDSILFCISYRLILHIISRKFFTQFSEHQRISVFYTIRCRVKVEDHIIAITHINGAIIMSSNVTTNNVHTIVFQAT